jgi:membrane protease YdiL (CAAX protease family)
MFELQKHPGRFSLPFLIYFGYTLTKGLWLSDLGPPGFWIADLVSFIVLPIALLVIFRLPSGPAVMDEERANRQKGFMVPIVVNGFLIAFVIWLIFAMSWVAFDRWGIDESIILPPTICYEQRMAQDGLWYYVTTVYYALTAAFVEEYFFRFLLRKALRPYTESAFAFVVISSTTFGLGHWAGGLHNMCAATLAGVLLSWTYVRAGDLRLPIVGHAFYWLRLIFR